MSRENAPKKGIETELQELKPCKNCGEIISDSMDYYCGNCGTKLLILPKDIEGIGEKEEFERLHDRNVKKTHEDMKNIFKFCVICGKSLEPSDKKGVTK